MPERDTAVEFETEAAHAIERAVVITEEFSPAVDPTPGGLVARIWAELAQTSHALSVWLEDMPGDAASNDEVSADSLALRFTLISALAIGAAVRIEPGDEDRELVEKKSELLETLDHDSAVWIDAHEEEWDDYDPARWHRAVSSLLFGASSGAASLGGVHSPSHEEEEPEDEDEWRCLMYASLVQAAGMALTAAEWFFEYEQG